jgi:membrane-associated phospholipid phosphatase
MRKTFLMMVLMIAVGATGRERYDLELQAGEWKSWTSGRTAEIVVAPPPGTRETKRELDALLARQASLADADRARVAYWAAGAPGYRWNQLAYDLSRQGAIPVERVYALLNVAIYDATVATWKAKYQYRRTRPHDASAKVRTLVPVTASPSYPSEHAAAAGAAAAVLAYLYPEEVAKLDAQAAESAASRVAAGAHYPSDVEAGLRLGRDVAARVIAWARKDGSDTVWEGSVPTAPGLWNGKEPYDPALATWRTWTLDKPSDFRPAPPPAFGEEALAEVKDPTNLSGTKRRAAFAWAIVSLAKYWNEQAALKIFEHHLEGNAPQAARIYATLSTAYYDALVACWDAKYAYWGIRPNQFDPTFKSQITTPNFPGYPSGHAVLASAGATVLASFFPSDAAWFREQAEETASSRLWGGVHFRVDNEVGLVLGRAIAEAALRRGVRTEAPR